MKTKIIILILLFAVLQIYAEIRFVSKTGSNTAPFLSWQTAADSIQKAINICKPGDTIYVANGVYQDTVRMTPGIALIGSGIDSCIIDGRKFNTGTYLTIRMQDSCAIENFKIIVSDGYNYTLSTTAISASNCYIKIRNNMIVDALYGIFTMVKTNSVIENNFITGQRCISISSLEYDAKVTISNNCTYSNELGLIIQYNSKPLIKNNVIRVYGDGIAYNCGSYYDTVSIYNNLIYCNSCMAGFFNLLNARLINNVIYGSFWDTGIMCNRKNVIKNNVVLSLNKGDGISVFHNDTTSQVSYNNSYGNRNNYLDFVPDSTNISVDPMFVNPDSLDFHLQMFSPIIDAGDPSIKDVDGSRSDIGLFGGPYGESYTYKDLAPRPPVNISLNENDKIITVKWNKNTEADFGKYKIYKSEEPGFTIDKTKLIASLKDTIYSEKITKSSYYKITSTDNQGNESKPGEEVGYIITGINEMKKTDLDYKLFNNYPNPFNPSTTISYRLKESGYVKITIYDTKGEKIETLVNENKEAGYHETEYNPHKSGSLASGVYLYRIDVKNKNNIPVFTTTNKLIYLK